MYKIPKREELLFHNGKFYKKNKVIQGIKYGIMIGFTLGGVIFANSTASYTGIADGDMIPMHLTKSKSIESKIVDYITHTNKEVPEKEAYEIAYSTVKWATQFQVDPLLVVAVQKVESGFNKYSISSAGALGIMQVIPSWHLNKLSAAIKEVGNPELFNVNTNIYLGTWVLQQCHNQFSTLKNKLLCYNGSVAKPNGYDVKVLASLKEINNFLKG
jgi:hypothetical protein